MTEQPGTAPSAAWIDGDPLMEAIAAAVWEHCETEGTMSLIVDDPRNIAVVAAAAAQEVIANRVIDWSGEQSSGVHVPTVDAIADVIHPAAGRSR